jgi:hypothetical protein
VKNAPTHGYELDLPIAAQCDRLETAQHTRDYESLLIIRVGSLGVHQMGCYQATGTKRRDFTNFRNRREGDFTICKKETGSGGYAVIVQVSKGILTGMA